MILSYLKLTAVALYIILVSIFALVFAFIDRSFTLYLKLNKQNLGDENPHPFVEWYFYSHPSVPKRIKKMEMSL